LAEKVPEGFVNAHGIRFPCAAVREPGPKTLVPREQDPPARTRLLCLNGWEASPGLAGAGTGPGKFPEGNEIGGK
jgi:hypothetical protein